MLGITVPKPLKPIEHLDAPESKQIDLYGERDKLKKDIYVLQQKLQNVENKISSMESMLLDPQEIQVLKKLKTRGFSIADISSLLDRAYNKSKETSIGVPIVDLIL